MICPHCHKDVEGTWTDEGIGPYEYCGDKGNDVQMVLLCENCEGVLEAEQSYADHVADMKEEYQSDRYFERDYD